jgi:uncharacterized membrane protein YhaH (DUF805 family)
MLSDYQHEGTMTFIESIQTCFQKYANFEGTARRSEYWWFFLFNVIASMILSQVSTTLSIVFSLATLLPSIAAATRRLHDTDRSGWWQLLYFLPIVGAIILIVFLAQESRPNRYGVTPAYAV